MLQLFSFLENKKIIFLALAIFVFVSTLSIPMSVVAENTTPSPSSGCPQVTDSGWCKPEDNKKIKEMISLSPMGEGAGLGAYSTNKGIWEGGLMEVALALPIFFVTLAYIVSAIFQLILSFILGVLLSNPITTDPNWLPVWGSIRDLGNMVIVLGFVVVGIATSLRVREYEAKKLLVPLILVAILINFSGLICGLIIDASNLVTGGLVGSSGPANMPYALLKGVLDTSQKILTWIDLTNSPWTFMLNCILFGVIYVLIAYTFIFLSIILLARYVILIILFILSPLAFTFWVFPVTKKLWNDWWNHFVKWCFIGVFASFTLFLTATIMKVQPIFADPASLAKEDKPWNMIISAGIVVGFLIVGIMMTVKKTGVAAMATSAVMLAATGGASLAMKSGKLLNNATGGRVSKMGQKLSQSTGQTLERFGLRAQGTTTKNAQKTMEDSKSRVNDMTEAEKTKVATTTREAFISPKARMDRLAAIQDKVKNGKLSDLGNTTQQQRAAIEWAEKEGKLRGVDTATLRRDAAKLNPNIANTTAEIRENTKKVSPTKAAEWDQSVMTPDVASSLQNNQLTEIGKRGSPALINKMKAYKVDPSKGFAGQTPEYKAAHAAATMAGPQGLSNFKNLQTHLHSDANFQ